VSNFSCSESPHHVALQRIRELLCRESLGRYMDAIFNCLLADVCDSQVRRFHPPHRKEAAAA
jgi:hypothetical protein